MLKMVYKLSNLLSNLQPTLKTLLQKNFGYTPSKKFYFINF